MSFSSKAKRTFLLGGGCLLLLVVMSGCMADNPPETDMPWTSTQPWEGTAPLPSSVRDRYE